MRLGERRECVDRKSIDEVMFLGRRFRLPVFWRLISTTCGGGIYT